MLDFARSAYSYNLELVWHLAFRIRTDRSGKLLRSSIDSILLEQPAKLYASNKATSNSSIESSGQSPTAAACVCVSPSMPAFESITPVTFSTFYMWSLQMYPNCTDPSRGGGLH